MPIERVITLHRNLVRRFMTTYSPKDGIVLWELQEQAICFRAVSLINWNIRVEIIRETYKKGTLFYCL